MMSINLIFSASVSRIVLLMSVQLRGWAGLGWAGWAGLTSLPRDGVDVTLTSLIVTPVGDCSSQDAKCRSQ